MKRSLKIPRKFLFLFLLVVGCGYNPETEIPDFLNALHQRGGFNGAALVAKEGRVVYSGGFGMANKSSGEKITSSTSFYLASVSKQFTTMAVMILKERGRLSYQDPVTKFFPDLPVFFAQVTIHHLMTHTSGIPDYYSYVDVKPGFTNKDVYRELLKLDSLQFAPGDEFSYSNSGYVLLALTVEKISGQPFHVFMAENIFRPLKMEQTLVYDPSRPVIKNRAIGYNEFGVENDYKLLTAGAGGIYSTVSDLFLWDRALYSEKLVSRKTMAKAYEVTKLTNDSVSNYGYGWGIVKEAGGKTVAHSGGLAGFRTHIARQLDKENTVILLTNNGGTRIGLVGRALLNILDGEPYTYPPVSIAAELNRVIESQGLEKAIERYHSLRKNEPEVYSFAESELNNLGYHLLSANKVDQAIEIFKLNVEIYPEAFNTYDSLGEGYMVRGDRDLAIINYEKSLQLNPENSNARTMLAKLRSGTD